jgi:hypothetical protein
MLRIFNGIWWVAALAASALAQAPLAITGVSDRATYTDSVLFAVPVVAGFGYTALLDGPGLAGKDAGAPGVRVPVVVTNVVSTVAALSCAAAGWWPTELRVAARASVSRLGRVTGANKRYCWRIPARVRL